MGQQQLLLLVLGIVIVGLAVVVGIQAFGENQKKANSDAITNDVIRIASDAQAWKLKPQAFGGGGALVGDGNFNGLTFAKLGYTTLATAVSAGTGVTACTTSDYSNLNGCYSLLPTTTTNVVITGLNTPNTNKVVATVVGTKPESITTVVSNG